MEHRDIEGHRKVGYTRDTFGKSEVTQCGHGDAMQDRSKNIDTLT